MLSHTRGESGYKNYSSLISEGLQSFKPVYMSKFYLTNLIYQRYFARVDDKFVTNLLSCGKCI